MQFTVYSDRAHARLALRHAGLWFDATNLWGAPLGPADLPGLDAAACERLLAALAAKRPNPLDLSQQALLPPLVPGARIFCIGLNYADHASESAMDRPAHPVVFLRTHESFTGHGRPLVLPAVSSAFDFEGELVAMIGRGGRHIPADDAARHIAGYTAGNDGSIRDYQLKRGTQWTLGKNFDGSGALGPCFVTADELPPLARGLKLHTRLNGEVVQSSDTRHLIFDLGRLVAALSEATELRPGDLILTGTPAGVGAVRQPPLFMKAGDVVEVEIEGIGTLRNTIEAERRA
jgi:acylpyruvate hydrolase